MEKAKVYFTKKIEPQSLIEIYKKLGITLPGKVAVKLHSGEEGNQNYLKVIILCLLNAQLNHHGIKNR